jgi:formate--tetrahydrofolate ligase
MRNLAKFGVPVVVAINRYTADTDAEVEVVREFCERFGVKAINCTHWADGGEGTKDLAEHVVELCDSGAAQFRTLYNDDISLWCMAKTQYSFSTDPNLLGAPSGHHVAIREIRLAAGAEFVVVVTGAIMTMPGLPRVPAANAICVNDEGRIEGLF